MPVRFKYFCFLVLSILVTGCSETTVEPTTGAITGTVRPINAASKIYLISVTDTLKTDFNKTDGTYEFTELAPGNYKISAKPTYGYAIPAPGPIIITAGQTTQAYPIRMPVMPAQGIFNVNINDSIYTGSPVYELFGQSGFSVVSGPYTFRFSLPKLSGTDSLDTATDPDLKMELVYQKQVWEANSSQGNLALNITYYDSRTRRGDAVFSFTAVKSGEKDIVGKGTMQFIIVRP